MFQVAYCDSPQYSNKVDQFFNFIKKIVKHGITSCVYSERADLIINKLNPELHPLQYNTILIACDSTFFNILNVLLEEVPSIKETTSCSLNCEINKKLPRPIVHFSYQTSDGKINDLQKFIDDFQYQKESICGYLDSGMNCNGIKKITSEISNLHLFIDILFWEGNTYVFK